MRKIDPITQDMSAYKKAIYKDRKSRHVCVRCEAPAKGVFCESCKKKIKLRK